MKAEIVKRRAKSVRHLLNDNRISCLIVTRKANVTYITGFLGDDSWAVIGPAGVWLITDSRYTKQARTQCPDCKIIERKGQMAEAVSKLVQRLKSVKTAAVEKSASIAALEALRKSLKIRIRTVADIIETARSIKDSGEVSAIKRGAKIAAGAFGKTIKHLRPTMTENETAGMLDFQIRRLGAVNSFDTIVAFGSNASRPHHQPGSRKLKKNDSVLIDFGVRYKGYCCDLTRCFAVGKPSAFYRKVYDAVKEAQAAAIKMVRAGVEIRRVDSAARDVIAVHNLPVYGHGTGHGLGLEVHELPVVAAGRKGCLKAGEVITIEPAVYVPGKLGVRIEDDVLVTETGCKILSRDCPHLPLLRP